MGLGVKLGVKVGAGVREASLNQFYLDREVKKKKSQADNRVTNVF